MDDDPGALDILRRQIADCDARLETITRERGRLVEAFMELNLKQRYGGALHAKPAYHLSDRHPLVQRKRQITAERLRGR